MTVTAPATRTPRAATLRKQEAILAEAERQFARFGFEGVSLDSIAAALDLSRQNLLYHWPSKEDLYRAVLDSVMGEWMASMSAIAQADEPEAAIQSYVSVKLRFSRERASGNAVFTREIMAGAPRYRDVLKAQVMPLLHADVERFEHWADQGLIRRLDFTHLMFLIWSSTQAYADLGPQYSLYMGKPALDEEDFERARRLLTDIIWRSLQITP
ncbi:TetR family transcriptional regulator C-terminal domain-containing protein [Pelomonas sp. UHG3]|uniref:TetR family transcriptional regulator C-terminal domain-containing protein n=1 Tax=Roseateles hydrophilus TaxID=2975054 RepID=A0ACC6C9P4_9BURK|nr:TetR family transcriptional regulator C-terminal domain-containing protein [Pelomonas sp. UHG3]MCY4745148.1 TetR family transcriptional regulator C-terminal domain-containing protein [Pelomonas sp. UHG3]